MKIWALTGLGRSVARTPAQSSSVGMSVLFFLRRHGNSASDEQISSVLNIDKGTLAITMRKLEGAKVVSLVSG